MDPVRTSILGVPGVLVLWGLALAAFGAFGHRAGQILARLRQGRYEDRFDEWGRRLRHALKHVLLQPRLFHERSIGLPHFLIFWGFVLYAFCFGWGLARGLLPFLPIPYPDQVPGVEWGLEIFAVLVLLALGVALARRLWFAPPHLHRSGDGYLILALIGFLMLTTLLSSAFRVVAASGQPLPGTPVGGWLSGLFTGMPPERAARLGAAMWWLHMLGVLGFLVYLPYSKHLHLLAAPFNVFFSQAATRPVGDLSVPGAREDVSAGAARWTDLTWKQLLSGPACAECGRCDRACPATAAGYALQPQQLVQKIKRLAFQSDPAAPAGAGASAAPALVGEVITPAELWACATCLACMERCAVWNEHVPLIVALRRQQVSTGQLDRGTREALASLQRYGNAFGKSERLRARWAQSAGLPLRDARKEPVEFLWFVGDFASYDPRCAPATQQTARLFLAAGLEVGLLYESERNAGNDARRLGEEGLFELLRDQNLKALARVRWKNGTRGIVTTDPHTFNTLKNEYPWNGHRVQVRHHTEVLEELCAAGRLSVKRRLTGRVTYHDPCYLGRYNGLYDPPRRLLRRLGLEVVEMPRHRQRSFCCGAGGGRIWLTDTERPRERPAESRVREAAALPGVHTLVVACPKDLAMFRDAVKTTGCEDRLAVRDVAELVAEAVLETPG